MFSRAKTLAQSGFTSPCAFQITLGFQKEKTRKACLFFLEVTPRFELLGRLSCGVRSCSRALFFKAFVLLRGMRWRRQIIGVGEKIGGNFTAAKAPLQLAAWGKIFLCGGACGFRREGVKLSEVGEGARIPARAGARSRAPKAGWFTSVARHFFSSLFRLIFAAFALALIAGGERDPARPCGTVRVPPRLFRLSSEMAALSVCPPSFSPPMPEGGIVSRARAALAVMIARRGRLRKVSAQISPLPVLKLYFTTSGKTGL